MKHLTLHEILVCAYLYLVIFVGLNYTMEMNFHLWIKDVNPKIVLDQKYKSGRGGLKAILDKATDMYKGSLFNYVDQNFPIIDHLHTPGS